MTDPRLLVLLGVAGALFATGLAGLISRSNLIKIVISLELLGKGVSLVFVTAGYISPTGDVGTSQAVVFTLIIIEAVVAAVALALVILTKRAWKTLDIAAITAKNRGGDG
jgi:NADH-quinone oxidoreductase subunit K